MSAISKMKPTLTFKNCPPAPNNGGAIWKRAFLSLTLPLLGAGGLLFLACLPALASPPDLSTPDLPNFHQTAPGIWRGAAPTEAGLRRLKAMGVKTVIDLRIAPKTVKKEGIYARSLGLNWINLPMGSDPPTPKEVSTLLATLKQAPSSPVFVHCQHGADRTGCMIGIYRVHPRRLGLPPRFRRNAPGRLQPPLGQA